MKPLTHHLLFFSLLTALAASCDNNNTETEAIIVSKAPVRADTLTTEQAGAAKSVLSDNKRYALRVYKSVESLSSWFDHRPTKYRVACMEITLKEEGRIFSEISRYQPAYRESAAKRPRLTVIISSETANGQVVAASHLVDYDRNDRYIKVFFPVDIYKRFPQPVMIELVYVPGKREVICSFNSVDLKAVIDAHTSDSLDTTAPQADIRWFQSKGWEG